MEGNLLFAQIYFLRLYHIECNGYESVIGMMKLLDKINDSLDIIFERELYNIYI